MYDIRKVGEPVKDELVRVNVLLGREQRRRLFHVLLDANLSFSEWVRQQVDAYLEKQEPKGKRKGKVV
jgi:hypothetical protein